MLLPNNQRQHRTSHAPKDVLPLRICANYCAPCHEQARRSRATQPRAIRSCSIYYPLLIDLLSAPNRFRVFTNLVFAKAPWRRSNLDSECDSLSMSFHNRPRVPQMPPTNHVLSPSSFLARSRDGDVFAIAKSILKS